MKTSTCADLLTDLHLPHGPNTGQTLIQLRNCGTIWKLLFTNSLHFTRVWAVLQGRKGKDFCRQTCKTGKGIFLTEYFCTSHFTVYYLLKILYKFHSTSWLCFCIWNMKNGWKVQKVWRLSQPNEYYINICQCILAEWRGNGATVLLFKADNFLTTHHQYCAIHVWEVFWSTLTW